jgi:hypothetical protein
MVVSMLHANPMCDISSMTIAKMASWTALSFSGSLIDHSPHRYGGMVASSSMTASCRASCNQR